MKKLNDTDLAAMSHGTFTPNDADDRMTRRELHLATLIPAKPAPIPEHLTIDLHNKTEEQAWQIVNNAAMSGARRATIITGASGILRTKMIEWAKTSILAPHIISCTPINNGSFDVRFTRHH